MSESELLEAITGMNQATLKEGKRAPHQPLLLLWLLGQLRQNGSTDTRYEDAEGPVSKLIDAYGPTANSRFRAELPFFHLSDSLWVLEDKPSLEARRRRLLDSDARGRLRPEVEALLLSKPGLIETIARNIVLTQFTDSYVEPIFLEIGLDPDAGLGSESELAAEVDPKAKKRDKKFRNSVLVAWRYQCAMCGFDGQVGGLSVGIEAAHVKWFAHGGPDELDNGLALCELHHALFDLGTIGLTKELKISVTEDFVGKNDAAKRMVYDLHGRDLLEPAPTKPTPAVDYVLWHASQVFKSAAA